MTKSFVHFWESVADKKEAKERAERVLKNYRVKGSVFVFFWKGVPESDLFLSYYLKQPSYYWKEINTELKSVRKPT